MAKVVTEADFFRVLQARYDKYALIIEREFSERGTMFTVSMEVGPVLYDVTEPTLLACFEALLDCLGL